MEFCYFHNNRSKVIIYENSYAICNFVLKSRKQTHVDSLKQHYGIPQAKIFLNTQVFCVFW